MKLLIVAGLLILGCFSKVSVKDDTGATGKVIKIVDGDTYDLLLRNNITRRIRMEGIDCPERGMAFYKVAKDYLGELCFGKIVRIKQTNTDRYGRVIAKTYLPDGSELGLLMIEAGYAWHFKRYSSELKLATAEMEARRKRAGLWIDDLPIAPWDQRKNAKAVN